VEIQGTEVAQNRKKFFRLPKKYVTMGTDLNRARQHFNSRREADFASISFHVLGNFDVASVHTGIGSLGFSLSDSFSLIRSFYRTGHVLQEGK
jgi:hypothetical protein